MMQAMLDRYIEIPQDGSWARIAGSQTAIATIVQRHLHWKMPLTVVALIEELPLAAVYSAMAFYYDNQSVIDKQIACLEKQPQNSIALLQQHYQGMLSERGYDTPEKIVELVRAVKQELVAEPSVKEQVNEIVQS